MTLSDRTYLITILVASYNRLGLLKECIKSIDLMQHTDMEILVIDDGSNNETKNWLNSLNEKRVRVIYQENMGAAKARQVGLEQSKGEYVCILDSDDQLLPDSLNHIKETIIRFPEISFFYSNNLESYDSGKTKFSNYKIFNSHSSFIRAIFLSPRVPFKHSGATFKRVEALKIGGYDVQLKNKIDIDFLLRYLKSGVLFMLIKQPIVVFKFHKNSISRLTRFKAISTWMKIIEIHGPPNFFVKNFYKLNRFIFETLKYIYESILFYF